MEKKTLVFKLLIITCFILLFNYSTAASADISTGVWVQGEEAPTTGSGGGDSNGGVVTSTRISDFNVQIVGKKVVVNTTINEPTRYLFYLGETPGLEMGVVSSGVFPEHGTLDIPGLAPGRRYYFKIILIDRSNNQTTIGVKSFETPPLPVSYLKMDNISGLSYGLFKDRVSLNWNNPKLEKDSYVALLRSNRFYPIDSYDGIPLYEGRDESYIDTYNLVPGEKYYYSIFVCSSPGNCSSGASLSIIFGGTKAVSLPVLPITSPPLEKVEFSADIKVFVDDREVFLKDGSFGVTGDKAIRLSVKMKPPLRDDIKTISIDIISEDAKRDVQATYLLKYNEKTDSFETSSIGLKKMGGYLSEITVFGLDKNIIATSSFRVYSSGESAITTLSAPGLCYKDLASFISCYWSVISVFSFIIIFASVYYLWLL